MIEVVMKLNEDQRVIELETRVLKVVMVPHYQ